MSKSSEPQQQTLLLMRAGQAHLWGAFSLLQSCVASWGIHRNFGWDSQREDDDTGHRDAHNTHFRSGKT